MPAEEEEIIPVKTILEGENDGTIPKLFENNCKPVVEEVIFPTKTILEGESDGTIPKLVDEA